MTVDDDDVWRKQTFNSRKMLKQKYPVFQDKRTTPNDFILKFPEIHKPKLSILLDDYISRFYSKSMYLKPLN